MQAEADLVHYGNGATRSADALNVRYDLIPPLALRRLAQRYALGAKTHGDHNWKLGMSRDVIYNHLVRHLMLYWEGDRSDDHLAAVAWGCCALMWYDDFTQEGGGHENHNRNDRE